MIVLLARFFFINSQFLRFAINDCPFAWENFKWLISIRFSKKNEKNPKILETFNLTSNSRYIRSCNLKL